MTVHTPTGTDARTPDLPLTGTRARQTIEDLGTAIECVTTLHHLLDRVLDGHRIATGATHGDQTPFGSGPPSQARPTGDAQDLRTWLRTLGSVIHRLDYAGRVAVPGCGTGTSAIMLARARPLATIHGFDHDRACVEEAREAARAAGVARRCTFDVAAAAQTPGSGYDLVCLIDRLHDLTEPLAVAQRARQIVAPHGAVMVVQPIGVPAAASRTRDVLIDAGFDPVRMLPTAGWRILFDARPTAP